MNKRTPAQSPDPEQNQWEKARLEERKRRVLRLILLAVLLIGLYALAKLTGVSEQFTVANLRSWTAEAGASGVILFVILFLIGGLLHVPGFVFVAVGVLSYSRGWGGSLSYLCAVASVCFTFVVVRTVGGKPLAKMQQIWINKALAHLDHRPIATIVLLRLVLIMTPALNYALALSNVRFRDYFFGSAIGLVLPILVFVFLFDHLILWLGYN